jgi:hypothetical protein
MQFEIGVPVQRLCKGCGGTTVTGMPRCPGCRAKKSCARGSGQLCCVTTATKEDGRDMGRQEMCGEEARDRLRPVAIWSGRRRV